LISFGQIVAAFTRWKHHLPVINLTLATGIVLVLMGTVIFKTSADIRNDAPRKPGTAATVMAHGSDTLQAPHKPAADFRLIGESNIFAADRTDWQQSVKKKDEGVKPVNILSPLIKQLKVQGVIRVENRWLALVNDLERKGSPKKVISVGVGDPLLGCNIVRINENGLKMECLGKMVEKRINNRTDYSYLFNEGSQKNEDSQKSFKATPSELPDKQKIHKKNNTLKLFGDQTGKGKDNPMGTINNLLELMKSIEH